MSLLDFTLPATDPNDPNSALVSPQEILRRRMMADALSKEGSDYSPVQSPWQGAARMADALLGGLQTRRLNAMDQAGQARNAGYAKQLAGYIAGMNAPAGGMGAAASTPAATAPGSYDATVAKIESGGNPNATNPVSKAAGLYQFVPSTWKQYMPQDGASPYDPNAATAAFQRFTLDNKKALAASLGRMPTDAELYLAHQQGAGGASKLLLNPNARAGDVVGDKAVAANGGDPNMSAGQFANMWLGKYNRIAGFAGAPPETVASNTNMAGGLHPFDAGPNGPGSMFAGPVTPQVAPAAPDPVMAFAGNKPATPAVAAINNASPAQSPSAAPVSPQASGAVAPPVPASAPAVSGPQADPAALTAILADPYASPQMQQVAASLLQLQGGFGGRNMPASLQEYTAAQKDPRFAQFLKERRSGDSAPGVHVINGALVDDTGKVIYKSEAPQVDANTVDSLADRLIAGDTTVLTGLARSAAGSQLIQQVQARVAQKLGQAGNGPETVLQARANQAGRMQEQRTLGGATANQTLYGNAAAATMDTAIAASRAVPRSTWLPVNQLLQAGQKAMSDPNLAAFATATNTLVNDYAKAITPTGAPTDSAREHARELLATAQSPEAYERVVNMMRWEVENTHRAIEHTKTELRSGGPSTVEPSQLPPGGPNVPGSQSVGVGQAITGGATPQQPPSTMPRQAPDGNFYVPDPNRPGKWMRVD